eukprot:1682674-Amphidinium_carterae.1
MAGTLVGLLFKQLLCGRLLLITHSVWLSDVRTACDSPRFLPPPCVDCRYAYKSSLSAFR